MIFSSVSLRIYFNVTPWINFIDVSLHDTNIQIIQTYYVFFFLGRSLDLTHKIHLK